MNIFSVTTQNPAQQVQRKTKFIIQRSKKTLIFQTCHIRARSYFGPLKEVLEEETFSSNEEVKIFYAIVFRGAVVIFII